MNDAAGPGSPPFDDRQDPWLVVAAVACTVLHLILMSSSAYGPAVLAAMLAGFGATLLQRTRARRFHSVTLGVYLVWMSVLATLAFVRASASWANC